VTDSIFDKTYTVKQLLIQFGILLLIAILIYIFLMMKYAWEHQTMYSAGPYKWDEKRKEVCAANKLIPKVNENKIEMNFGRFTFQPSTRFGYSILLRDNPECIGYVIRQGLYGGKEGSFKNIYVNKNNKTVAEITVIYTDKRDE
jgi:uncharacterized protein YqgQ